MYYEKIKLTGSSPFWKQEKNWRILISFYDLANLLAVSDIYYQI